MFTPASQTDEFMVLGRLVSVQTNFAVSALAQEVKAIAHGDLGSESVWGR